VEEARSIDAARLRRKGFFSREPGTLWTSSWGDGETEAKVSYWREDYLEEPFLLWFRYNVQRPGEEWFKMEYPVEIQSTECHFGGLRHWFICPLSLDGKECGRRCRVLYLAGGMRYFGCRECQRLTYATQRFHRDTFWHLYHKHNEYVERAYMAYQPPRGKKAKERRERLLAAAEQQARRGEAFFGRLLAP
jgi:hypothetical protein